MGKTSDRKCDSATDLKTNKSFEAAAEFGIKQVERGESRHRFQYHFKQIPKI